MDIKKKLIKKYMKVFSRIDNPNARLGCALEALKATSAEDKQQALLEISKIRHDESKINPMDQLFRTDLKQILSGKDVLEIGSGWGGSSLAYFEMYNLKSIAGIECFAPRSRKRCMDVKPTTSTAGQGELTSCGITL